MASNFFGALFGGQSLNLDSNIGKTSAVAGFDTSLGEGNATAGSDFNRAIVSGDATKTSQALAPAISADKVSTQQSQKTATEMGTRSGGTAASNNASSDKVHSDITNLIGSLTSKSADNLLSSGSTFLNQGEAATIDNANLGAQQFANWKDSILGKGITGAAQAGEAAGLGAGFGSLPGGPGAAAGAQGALSDVL